MSREKAKLEIAELTLPISDADGSPLALLVGTMFQVDVEFDYTPGSPEIGIPGPWEDSEPGEPAQLDIRSIKMTKATPFNAIGMNLWLAKGYEMMPFFTRHEIEAMEEQLLARALKGKQYE